MRPKLRIHFFTVPNFVVCRNSVLDPDTEEWLVFSLAISNWLAILELVVL